MIFKYFFIKIPQFFIFSLLLIFYFFSSEAYKQKIRSTRARGVQRTSPNPRHFYRNYTKNDYEDCLLFRANDTIALTQSLSTYVNIGDIDVSDNFQLQMKVFPSPLNHNGILFSIGSSASFGYYEWKTKAVHTQFLVVEFIFSALALTVKALNMEHLQQIEIYKTYPIPYRVDDASWHDVRVYRDRTSWRLELDDLFVTRPVTNSTNVNLRSMTGFLGGRPNYTDHQFQGIIKNVKINRKPISIKSLSNSHVSRHKCDDAEILSFDEWSKRSRTHYKPLEN